jgi:hypothetical protein
MIDRTLLINALIYFGLISIVVGLISILSGGLIHGMIMVRVVISLLLAKIQPIKDNW